MKYLVVVMIMLLVGGVWDPTSFTNIFPSEDSDSDTLIYEGIKDALHEDADYTDADSLLEKDNMPYAYLSEDSFWKDMKPLSSFTRFRKECYAEFAKTVFFEMKVDFPKPSSYHADVIGKWLVEKMIASLSIEEDLPPITSIYIRYTKRQNLGCGYEGDVHNYKRIAKYISSIYFAIKKGEYGTNVENYPSTLFSIMSFQAKEKTDKYVTYQQFSHEYNGGAHGYYTERLISFDHVHKQEINYNYLFKDNCMQDILAILIEEAKKQPCYRRWNPNIDEYTCVRDENDNPTGMYRLPQPGLSKEGIVFSFQPYSISCFAAGVFHFVIPYERLWPYLTDRAKWCLSKKRNS